MIRTRLLVTAFLINNGDLLLMRRPSDAKLLPGMWAPVGGHIEPTEYNTPQVACEREIHEETGLSAKRDLCSLSLRYIVHRLRDEEIRIQYCFFGSTLTRTLGSTDEGELHWIPLDHVLALNVSATTRFTLEHYIHVGSSTRDLYVGAVEVQDGRPKMTWSVLSDWEQ